MKKWASNRKLRLISIGYRNDWADEQWITANPYDFPQFIAEAEAVATNFFHGCVFALLNEKPFVCEASVYRNYKISNLLSLINGEHHFITEQTSDIMFNTCLNENFDPAISSRLDVLRAISAVYLDKSLAVKELNPHGSFVKS